MARPKINGTLQPIRTKFSTRSEPTRGLTTTQEFESAGDNLGGLALQCIAAGMQVDWTANATKSRLVATTTGAASGVGIPETTTSTWQLYTAEIQQDIREHPNLVSIGPWAASLLDRDLANLKRWTGSMSVAFAQITAGEEYVAYPNLAAFLSLMLHGTTSFEVNGYSARASISLPFLFAGAIPGVSPDSLMADLIGDIPIGGANDGTLFRWGWRRRGTSRTFSGNNRTEIAIEWTLSSWSIVMYGDEITDLPE